MELETCMHVSEKFHEFSMGQLIVFSNSACGYRRWLSVVKTKASVVCTEYFLLFY